MYGKREHDAGKGRARARQPAVVRDGSGNGNGKDLGLLSCLSSGLEELHRAQLYDYRERSWTV